MALPSLLPSRPQRAHVLLQLDPGRAPEAVQYLAGVPGVVEAVATGGAYDVIAVLAAPDLRRTLDRVRRTPGLAVLRTCRPG